MNCFIKLIVIKLQMFVAENLVFLKIFFEYLLIRA